MIWLRVIAESTVKGPNEKGLRLVRKGAAEWRGACLSRYLPLLQNALLAYINSPSSDEAEDISLGVRRL